jgi:uncharacterized membrane protein SirB2
MDAFYLELRTVHIGAVTLSGLLMLVRAVAWNGWKAGWAMARPIRILAYAIDTTLLAAAVMLTLIVQQYPFADGWLTAKVLLLLLYIALGYRALRARSATARWLSLAAAALVFGFIVAVARAHHPLGIFV